MRGLPSVILCAHGTRSAAGVSAVAGLAGAVRALMPRVEVAEAFLDVAEPRIEAALADAGGRPTVVVPLLLSAGYHVHVDLARLARGGRDVALTPALGPDPRLTEVLADRLVAAGMRSGDAVVLAAAGSSDPRAAADLDVAASLLARRLGRPVSIAQASGGGPRVEDAVEAARSRGARRVALASYLLAPGFFASRLAACDADVVAAPILTPGAPPPPALLGLVLARIRSVDHARAA